MDAYELDIASGELTLLAENPGQVATGSAAARATLTRIADGHGDVELSQWDPTTTTLRPIAVYDGVDYPLGIAPIVVTPDGTGLWLGSNRGTDRTRLVRLDMATGEEIVVDSHPTFDLGGQLGLPSPLILSSRTGELLGVRYLGERQVIQAHDPNFAEVLENLTKLSDGDLGGHLSDDSGQRWVASFAHDREPGLTYYYDHSTGESRLLFRPYPHLDPEALAPMTAGHDHRHATASTCTHTSPCRSGSSRQGCRCPPRARRPVGTR